MNFHDNLAYVSLYLDVCRHIVFNSFLMLHAGSSFMFFLYLFLLWLFGDFVFHTVVFDAHLPSWKLLAVFTGGVIIYYYNTFTVFLGWLTQQHDVVRYVTTFRLSI